MPESKRVLVVDADPDAREQVVRSLTGRPAVCVQADSANAALAVLKGNAPDLMVTEMVLPDLSGPALCRVVREELSLSRLPIIAIGYNAAEMDRVLAFESGVDDFLAKPFSPAELAARVYAVLRGFGSNDRDNELGTASARVDPTTRRAQVAGHRLDLSPREFDLLQTLIARSGRVVRRDELLKRVWRGSEPGSERVVDAHVKSIRRKLGDARDCIETVRGVGYRFCERP